MLGRRLISTELLHSGYLRNYKEMCSSRTCIVIKQQRDQVVHAGNRIVVLPQM
ncbi:hypothetical protein KIN20_006494 [Parelaphostrongylus tenuis]|uniref:Uncharacterized protein n=1 Tax=Parelaphostrongylus tenuis TaxID=148309 RepID=A0AAD5QG00_PARTN|nr:hypothetical protein KIN20_006494 [Parelaphostrongylus tenuis]